MALELREIKKSYNNMKRKEYETKREKKKREMEK